MADYKFDPESKKFIQVNNININVNVTGDNFADFVNKFLQAVMPTDQECYTGTELQQAELKFKASMLLNDPSKGLVIPTADEWLGLNLLERDDDIRRFKNAPTT